MTSRVSKLQNKKAIATLGRWIERTGPDFTPESLPERIPTMGPVEITNLDNPRYLQREGIPLEWVGAGSADLGLTGIATEAMTAKVLQHGHGPQGQALRTEDAADDNQGRVLAYSAVYSAPKSISLLIAADNQRVREAAHQALRAASEAYLSALEQQVTVRRGKAGVRSERIKGLVAVRAIHQTSSTGDPHIHTHWMILSSAPSEADGAWRALDGRAFFQAQKLAEARANRVLRNSLSASLGIHDWMLHEAGSAPFWEIAELLDADGALSRARKNMQQIADHLDVPFALRSRKMDTRLWRQHREQKQEFAEKMEHALDEALHQGGDKASAIRRLWQDHLADAGLLNALRSIQPGPRAHSAPASMDFSDLSHKSRPTTDALHQARTALQPENLANLKIQCQAAHARITRFDHIRAALPLGGNSAKAKLAEAQKLDKELRDLQAQQAVLDTEQVFQAADNLLDDLTQELGTFTPSDIAARLIVTQDMDLSGSQQATSHLLRYWVRSGQIHLRAGCNLDVICHVLENHGFSPVTADRHMATRTQALIPDARLRAERALAEQAKTLSERGRNRIIIPIPPTFTAEQAHTAAVLAQGRALTVTSGVAGSGKSYLAKPIVQAARHQGFTVRVIARNRALAEALKAETGADAVDVFATFDPTKAPPRKVLYIVDESGLADAEDLKAVLQAVENHKNAQAWLIGDRAQSQPIDRRAAFAVVEQAVVPEAYTTLRTSYRCRAWEAEHDVLRQVADVPALVESVQQAGRLIRDGNDEEDRRARIAGLAEQYRAQGEDVLILSRSNAEAGAIAEYVQAHRGITIHPATALRYEQQTGVGDIVRTRLNDRQRGIRNGDVWTVSQVTEDGSLWLSAVKNPRRKVRVDKGYTEQAVELAYAATADAAQGVTVDRAILDVSGMGKSLLYSAATRGRQAPVYAGDLETALHRDDVTATMRELLGPEREALTRKTEKIQEQPLRGSRPSLSRMLVEAEFAEAKRGYLQPELQRYDAALSHRLKRYETRIEELIAHYETQLLPEDKDLEKERWRELGFDIPSGEEDDWWRIAKHPEPFALRDTLSRLRAAYEPLAKRQNAQEALEQAALETERAQHRGILTKSDAIEQVNIARQRAEEAGLPVAIIKVALSRAHLRAQQRMKQERQAQQERQERQAQQEREKQAQREREAAEQIRALTVDIWQKGGWEEDRHRPVFEAAGFVPTGENNIYRHPLESAAIVAEAKDAFFRALDETLKAREQLQQQAEQQRIEQVVQNIQTLRAQIYQNGYDEQSLLDAGFYGNSNRQWTHHDANDSKVAEAAKQLFALVEQVHLDEAAVHMAITRMQALDGANPADHSAEMGCGRLVCQAGHWQLQGDPNYLSAPRNDLIQAYDQAKQRYDALTELRNAILNQNRAPSRNAALSAVKDAMEKAFKAKVSKNTIEQVVYETQATVEKNRPTPPPPPPPSSWRPRGPR